MHARSAISTAVLLLGLTTAAGAQPASGRSASARGPEPGEGGQTPVDVDRLPIDVARILRGLRQSTIREERDGLHLKYFVDVYGQAPHVQLFTSRDNLLHGPVPYGAPTHSDILQVITPQEFRAPVADFGALLRWLSDKAKDKK